MSQRSFLSGGWAVIVPLTGAIAAYLTFVFLPQMKEINTLRQDIATKHAYLASAAQHATHDAQIDEEIAETRDYLKRYRGASAGAGDASRIFADLADCLKSLGVATTMFRPEGKESFATIDRIPLTIGCLGDYDQLQSLPARIERMQGRIWIEELTLERSMESGGKTVCEIKPAIFVDNFEISD